MDNDFILPPALEKVDKNEKLCRKPLHGEQRNEEEKKEFHDNQKERDKQEIKSYGPDTPVVFDVNFNNTDPKIPLQLDSNIRLNSDK